GAGGFINISQAARAVVFVGTFTTDGLRVSVDNGALRIDSEGKAAKFVREVEQRTFSGEVSRRRGQRVLYVTERCVFRLVDSGLELIEIAPGIDLQRDILAQMEFVPAVSPDLRPMDAALFLDVPMGLRERLLHVPMVERVALDAAAEALFINFEGLAVQTQADIEEIEAVVVAKLGALGHKVDVIVNYDHFSIRPELLDGYSAMVQRLSQRHYRHVTRYGAAGFLKARLERAAD
ncbi:MAG: acyl CoA:acetate/3-ketoacid CoA transferase, partial [Rhizobacter sp.]|nr:acyl CoA:acetate/3-ketoacid CoA transferase [Rhizobacter sp.]